MDSLPPVLLDFISVFRPLMRAEVFDSFTYLLCGLLIGEAKHGTVRASVFAPAYYQPQRLSDLFCRHTLSRQAVMAQLTQHVLAILYPSDLPARLFWLADSTLTEKPFVWRVASVELCHRAKRLVGRAKHLQGHCYVFAAHLYRRAHKHWASVLLGVLLYVKGRSIPQWVGKLAQQLRLPAQANSSHPGVSPWYGCVVNSHPSDCGDNHQRDRHNPPCRQGCGCPRISRGHLRLWSEQPPFRRRVTLPTRWEPYHPGIW